MRAVAHGIYPPLLEAEGLEAALIAAIRTIPVPVGLEAADLGRYDRSVEESLYFAVLGILSEALDQGATAARISLKGDDRLVGFSVLHDGGVGELVPVEDRVDAFGGSLTVNGDRGGVVVSGQIPSDASSLEFA
jgi:signal transduction histidine kinase